jgi:RHS repeat-associated protein
MRKSVDSDEWDTAQVTHYTGIGTEVRENYAGSTKDTKVVVNMPQGLGRYGIEDAERPNYDGVSGDSLAGYIPNAKFEWYLKNHLGSTMLVYGTQSDANPQHVFVGTPLAAYDYRAFGEMVEMLPPAQKVTENFTGKEHDDEIALDYFGARYLDPMLGMWISVDPKRQFASPHLYAGNGYNPINVVDPDGNETLIALDEKNKVLNMTYTANDNATVTFNKPGIEPFTAAEPPLQSYFFDKNEDGSFKNINAVYVEDMDDNAQTLLKMAEDLYPFGDITKWGTGGKLDFKNQFYNENVRTIGTLNGTAMTPRDAGNAIWGGWTRQKYYTPYFMQRAVSNGYAIYKQGKLEDTQSSVMQIWGFSNYKPK